MTFVFTHTAALGQNPDTARITVHVWKCHHESNWKANTWWKLAVYTLRAYAVKLVFNCISPNNDFTLKVSVWGFFMNLEGMSLFSSPTASWHLDCLLFLWVVSYIRREGDGGMITLCAAFFPLQPWGESNMSGSLLIWVTIPFYIKCIFNRFNTFVSVSHFWGLLALKPLTAENLTKCIGVQHWTF